MNRTARTRRVAYSLLTLDARRYAVVPETLFLEMARRLELEPADEAAPAAAGHKPAPSEPELDAQHLAARLIERRKHAGLSQTQLARRARIRVETLNRIERGHTTPDFATIRKLVQAMERFERREVAAALGPATDLAMGE